MSWFLYSILDIYPWNFHRGPCYPHGSFQAMAGQWVTNDLFVTKLTNDRLHSALGLKNRAEIEAVLRSLLTPFCCLVLLSKWGLWSSLESIVKPVLRYYVWKTHLKPKNWQGNSMNSLGCWHLLLQIVWSPFCIGRESVVVDLEIPTRIISSARHVS